MSILLPLMDLMKEYEKQNSLTTPSSTTYDAIPAFNHEMVQTPLDRATHFFEEKKYVRSFPLYADAIYYFAAALKGELLKGSSKGKNRLYTGDCAIAGILLGSLLTLAADNLKQIGLSTEAISLQNYAYAIVANVNAHYENELSSNGLRAISEIEQKIQQLKETVAEPISETLPPEIHEGYKKILKGLEVIPRISDKLMPNPTHDVSKSISSNTSSSSSSESSSLTDMLGELIVMALLFLFIGMMIDKIGLNFGWGAFWILSIGYLVMRFKDKLS
jgi:hypothetical protein